MNKVIDTMLASGTLRSNSCVIVGFSGGPDSLCLLHALKELSGRMQLMILPIHIDHQLRENSKVEAEHAVSLCKAMGLDCTVQAVDVQSIAEQYKVSVEEAGRTVRYQVFGQIAAQLEEQGVDREHIMVAVAHNADDQSETILQRVIRGTGIRGLAGIRPVRLDESGYYIIRPLLDVPRSEIEAYLEEHQLEANRDESNEMPEYTRNRIRIELIPYIEEHFNPNVKESLRTLGDVAAVDDNYMDQVAAEEYANAAEIDTINNTLALSLDPLVSLHLAVLRRVVAMALRDIGLDAEIRFDLVMGVIGLLFSDSPSAHLDLPGDVIAERQYQKLIFRSGEEVAFDPNNHLLLVRQVVQADAFVRPEKRVYAIFDFNAFREDYRVEDIVLRTRMPGDVIAIGGGKHKKIQDYMVDAKIPKNLRNQIPIVAVGNEVLWIPPHDSLPTVAERNNGRFSQKYHASNGTKSLLFLEITERL